MKAKPSNYQDTQPSAIVRQIVNRVHVGESNRDMLQYFRSRLNDNAFTSENYELRHETLKQAVEQHMKNRAEYRWIMQGGLAGSSEDYRDDK